MTVPGVSMSVSVPESPVSEAVTGAGNADEEFRSDSATITAMVKDADADADADANVDGNGDADATRVDVSLEGCVCRWFPSRLLSPSSVPEHRGASTVSNGVSVRARTYQLQDEHEHEHEDAHTNGISRLEPTPNPYALLILNQPLNTSALSTLLPHAELVVCADGGANWYLKFYEEAERRLDPQRGRHGETPDTLSSTGGANTNITSSSAKATASNIKIEMKSVQQAKVTLRLPDAVIGDLDSVHARTRSFFEQKRVPFIHDPDQYSTDFTKCLKWIRAHPLRHDAGSQDTPQTKPEFTAESEPLPSNTSEETTKTTSTGTTGTATQLHPDTEQQTGMDVVAMGSLAGRVDQGLSQIHHLYLAASDPSLLHPTNRIYLLSESSLSFVLDYGVNEIHIDDWEGPLLPQPALSPSSSRKANQDESGQSNGESASNREIVGKTGLGKDDEEGNEEGERGTRCVFTENVGILPMVGPAWITTSGLEWDVVDWPTVFGGQLSTSNHIRARKVVVDVKREMPLRGDTANVNGNIREDQRQERRTTLREGTRCLFTLELANGLKDD